ncbi:MAG TPA: TRAP transporter substrate-binding protein [Candidatus Sulfotelmatobacter sp.]|nr:TRAP transporter substrate-binding protein [Candidatus Sulfotelmatobacter sp.]
MSRARRSKAAWLVGVLCALLLAAAPAWPQTLEWTLATEYPATSMAGEGLQHLAEALGQASGGRIAAKPTFDAESGFRSAGMPPAVAGGFVMVGDAINGALRGFHPVFVLPSLPFLVTSTDDALRLYHAARPTYEKVFADSGQRLLYVTPWPASGIWAKKPITQPDDLRGLAIRVYDPVGLKVLRAAGAKPERLIFGEAVSRIKEGSIAAVLSTGDNDAGRRLWEYLPHFTEITYVVPLSFTTLNLATWKRLPGDLQRAVGEAAAATEERQWRAVRARIDENYAGLRANGVTITTTISPALRRTFTRAARSAEVAWQNLVGPTGQHILARYRQPAGKP